MDANEQFRPTPHSQHQEQAQGGTGRGDSILAWLLLRSVRLPPDTTQDPRRLDYGGIRAVCSIKGEVGEARDMKRSDHEPVLLQLWGEPPKPATTKPRCGPRHVHITDQDQLNHLLDPCRHRLCTSAS